MCERTPSCTSSTLTRVDRTRLRIRAVLVLMESVNPSFEPRITFSESGSCTPMPGYPLSAIFNACPYPSTKRIASPVSIPCAASSMVSYGVTSEIPIAFSLSTRFKSLSGSSDNAASSLPKAVVSSSILLTATSIYARKQRLLFPFPRRISFILISALSANSCWNCFIFCSISVEIFVCSIFTFLSLFIP